MPFRFPPSPSPTFLDFAALCAAVYHEETTSVGKFTRVEYRAGSLGFQGAIYRRGNDWVVAYAGTNVDEWGDLIADAGFGDGFVPPLVGMLSPHALYAILLTDVGAEFLRRHCVQAEELLAVARTMAGSGARVYICGHSLGGGIAQVLGSRQNMKAVAISTPVVSRVPGIVGKWSDVDHIICLQFKGDLINGTAIVGHCLGRVILLDTERHEKEAIHSIELTQTELSPGGRSAEIGARDPFGAYDTPIDRKYKWLQEHLVNLGEPTEPETAIVSINREAGSRRNYVAGSIFHHPDFGAFLVYGHILAHYQSMGESFSTLGFPISDEQDLPDGSGRFNDFQFGVISWTRATGQVEVLSSEVSAPAPTDQKGNGQPAPQKKRMNLGFKGGDGSRKGNEQPVHNRHFTIPKIPEKPIARGDSARSGELLGISQSLKSANGRYTFVFQTDGNLVLYKGQIPLWASNTSGQRAVTCIMQSDGNLVIYHHDGHAIWSSNTYGNPGSYFIIQDDGNAVIYSSNKTPIWSSGTFER